MVSILIPCFNAERWLSQCIESALAQTWPDKEVIVVDDGSTDGSLAIIRGFGERIRWETGPNRGGNAARNRLLELAQGDWLQYLDADDYLLPKKLERQMEILVKHPTTDVVCSPVRWLFQRGARVRDVVTPIPPPHDDPWILLARWWLPQTGGTLWRRAAVIQAGNWASDQPCCQEHELYLRLLMNRAEFHIFDECHAVWRDWTASDSVSKRNITEVRERRLEVLARMESHLRSISQDYGVRLQAINQTRLEIARTVWQTNREKAFNIISDVHRSQRKFLPDVHFATLSYRVVYRLFGFAFAERVATIRRRLLGSTGEY